MPILQPKNPVPIYFVEAEQWPARLSSFSVSAQNYSEAMGYKPLYGRVLAVPNAAGDIECVLLGIGTTGDLVKNPFLPAKLVGELPKGTYFFADPLPDAERSMIGIRLASYKFTAFKDIPASEVIITPPEGVDMARIEAITQAVMMGRDLINRPANDLTPTRLAEAARALGAEFGAKTCEIVGDALLEAGYPLIHAVGRAAVEAPRLIDMTWGDPAHPKVTLVGKGVVFDTGGLNIKPDASMLMMKKDMGGAAVALSTARMVMALGIKVRLRVLLPIVENSIASSAFRPGDIYRSRKGTTIEIGNTDAEGRLILADALTLADEEKPDLLLDFATLTGAARVALGPDIPAFFTPDDDLAEAIMQAGIAVNDPVWRLPLWMPYQSMLESKVADMNNVSSGGLGGAITAALFLKSFVSETQRYAHFDLYGWCANAQPGKPVGGEPQVARLALHLIEAAAAKR